MQLPELLVEYWHGESQSMQLPPVFVSGTVVGPNVDNPPQLLVERSIVFGPADHSSLMEEDAQHRPFDAMLTRTPDFVAKDQLFADILVELLMRRL